MFNEFISELNAFKINKYSAFSGVVKSFTAPSIDKPSGIVRVLYFPYGILRSGTSV